MSRRTLGPILVGLLLSTQVLAAQQRGVHQSPDTMGKGMMMGERMHQQMDSLNARLDTLVGRMNRATGNAKVAAMAQVINELVAQRRLMHTHMREMMKSHGGMMGGKSPSPGRQAPPTDTTGHAEHHPGPAQR